MPPFANTEDEYGLIARLFHWSIAVLVLGLLPVGLFMTGMENSPLKFEVYALHKSFGLLVFFLGLGRIIWRFLSPPPEHLETHARWETLLAGAAHFWLYVCVIGMPLTGWLMSSALEFPVPFFGGGLPWIIGKDEGLGQLFGRLHGVLAYTLLVILALHIAGALKHRLIDRDMTLQRMTFNHRGMVFPALLILIAGSVFAVCGVLAAKGLLQERGGQEEALSESRVTAAQGEGESAAKEAASDAPAARRPDTSKLGADEWAIVQSSSTLSFRTTMYGTPFTGVFSHFDGDIRFNPADLDTARADIVIALTDVKTGDADRDSSITGPEWFDTERAAAARFETLQFDHLGGDEYLAIGNLTLRGVTMPVKLPFTLVIDGDTARMTAHTTLNRLDFGMGGEGWDDAATVGHDVDVLIDLTAIR